MVEGETFKSGERSTQTIPRETLGERWDLSHRLSTPVTGGQKNDVKKFDGKIIFGI